MNLNANEITSATDNRQKLIYSSQIHWFHWLIIALSALLTYGAWYIASEQVDKRLSERFERESLQVIELVKERMQLYEHALLGAVAHIDASDNHLTNAQWKKYSNSLQIDKAYPGINGLGVIFNIQEKNLAPFIEAQQKDRPNFGIHPAHNEHEYWPITYIEPLVTNQQAVGLDMAFEQNRYSGIKKSRDTGLAQLTGPITLVQDAKKTPGFLFFAPFYQQGSTPNSVETRRRTIRGVTYAPFIMHKLISGTLAINKRHVTLKISDNGQSLYSDIDNIEAKSVDLKPLFSSQIMVELYGREWLFVIDSNLSFREASGQNQPYFILAGGIFIDFLLLALFIVLSRTNRRSLDYADEVTRELKVKTKRLIKSNQDLEQFAYVASHDLKSPLNAIKKLVSWISEDCEKILPDSSKEHLALLVNRTTRMNKLLDDLLDYARIGRHNFAPVPIELKATADEIFSLLDHPVDFKLSVDEQQLLMPRTPLEIVLRNLISNAIKHHDKTSGHIQISCTQANNMHHICVQDDGPGIPSELFDKALEMFQTLRPRDKVEGSGMGLSLSKKTIEHYGGTLTIESDGIRGTKIMVLWPVTPEKLEKI